MKSNHFKIDEQEKQRILEMHQSQKGVISEQKIFSGLKAGVKGLNQRLKTGVQNVKSSFSTTNANAKQKSAGLEQDLASFKSRCSDLSKSVDAGYRAIYEISQKLAKDGAYGQGYDNEQKDFAAQINNILTIANELKTSCDGMSTYQVNYETAPTQSTEPAKSAAQPTAKTPQGQSNTEPVDTSNA